MVDVPLTFPNLGNALAAGAHARYFGQRADLEQAQEDRRAAAQPYVAAAMGGDPAAMAKVASGDPQTAVAVTTALSRMDANTRARVRDTADYTARAANAVLQADPADRPAVYAQMLKEGQGLGYNMSTLPPAYSPQVDGILRGHRAMAVPILEQLKLEENRPQPMMPGGGSPMPGAVPGSGAPQGAMTPSVLHGAIVGQESGGQQTGTNGQTLTSVNGAQGVGQMLPATFKQYALPGESIDNRADNLRASGRAIDDYYRKYNGDPARVAVAYFSGEGNVAPPGSPTPWINDAADGNGVKTSAYVQSVLRRAGVAGGMPAAPAAQPPTQVAGMPNPPAGLPGQPAQTPAPPVQLAGPPQAVTAPNAAPAAPAGVPGAPPAAPPAQGLTTGIKLAPGQRMMGIRGVPVVKDGNALVLNPDGSQDWVPMPKPMERPQPPQGYQWVPGQEGKTLQPIPGGPAAAGGTGNPSGLTGADYLATLPTDRAAQILALKEGRMVMSPRLQSSPQGKQLLSDLFNAFPDDYDAVLNGQRSATAKAFASGKPAQTVASLNQTISHGVGLVNSFDALSNKGGFGAPILNYLENQGAKLGDAGPQGAFEMNRKAFVDELSSVFKQTGATDAEIRAWDQTLSMADTPATFKAKMGKALELLQGRLDSLASQYQAGMGTKLKTSGDLLSPQARQQLQYIESKIGDSNPEPSMRGNAPAVAPQQGGPVQVQTPEDAMKLAPGTQFVTPDGRVKVRP